MVAGLFAAAPAVPNERLREPMATQFFNGFNQGVFMNKDQVKGTVKDAAGKIQEKTGQMIGSADQQAKGIKKQVEGKTQKAVGDIKEVVKDAGQK